VHRRSTRLSSYLEVPSEGALAFLEVEYVNRPRESKADSSLTYPKRSLSWIWLAGGILVYFILPWPKHSAPSLTNDRTSIMIVDVLGTVFAAIFFGIPLYAVNFTEEVLGSEIGIAVFCLRRKASQGVPNECGSRPLQPGYRPASWSPRVCACCSKSPTFRWKAATLIRYQTRGSDCSPPS
jgi:hypothetical protein